MNKHIIKLPDEQRFGAKLIDNEDNYVLTIDNEIQLYSVRAQIAEKGLKGYTIEYKGLVISIDSRGRLDEWPKEFCETDDYLDTMLGK